MLFCILITTYCLLPTDSIAQVSFERAYGDTAMDYGRSVQVTSDGGYVITGYSESFGSGGMDVYTVRTDSLGDTLWTRSYGGPADDYGLSVDVTSGDGFIIAGYSQSFGSGSNDIYLIITNASGDPLWTRTYGDTTNDVGLFVQEVSQGGFIVAGYTTSSSAGGTDAYLIRTNSTLDTLWTRTYGDSTYEYGYSVDETQDGGFILAGQKNYSGGVEPDIFLVRTDSLGNTLWTKTYGDTLADVAYSVRELPDGSFIVAANKDNSISGIYDVYLMKLNAAGDTVWTKTYGDSLTDFARSLEVTSDGGFIIVGQTYSFGAGEYDIYLIRTDSSGDTLWSQAFGYSSSEIGMSVKEVQNDVYIIGGYTNSIGSGSTDFYLLKPKLWGPSPLSAVASDNINPVPGIDDDDYVLITFNEPTNKPVIDALNIDNVLQLDNGHSWIDGFGGIGSALWNPLGDGLLITLSITVSPPTIAVGDMISPDGVTIQDTLGNPTTNSIIITGSFNPVGVEEEENSDFGMWNAEFRLNQNNPNPFYSSTLISYTLPGIRVQRPGVSGQNNIPVRLEVYDITGRLVETLVDKGQEPGIYQVEWDGKDHSSGVYFYRLQAGDFISTKRLILLR
jgi:hypothetical protein